MKKGRLVTPVPSAQYLSLKVTTVVSLKISLAHCHPYQANVSQYLSLFLGRQPTAAGGAAFSFFLLAVLWDRCVSGCKGRRSCLQLPGVHCGTYPDLSH